MKPVNWMKGQTIIYAAHFYTLWYIFIHLNVKTVIGFYPANMCIYTE